MQRIVVHSGSWTHTNNANFRKDSGDFVVLAVAAGIAYLFRSDPIGPILGKMPAGVEAPYTDTSPICCSDETVALETRPEVRIKTGNAIYRTEAIRVVGISLSKVARAIKDGYPAYTDRMTDAARADTWYVEINFL